MSTILKRTSIFSDAWKTDSDPLAYSYAHALAQPVPQVMLTPYLANQPPTGNVVIVGTQSVGNMLLANTAGIADADGLGTFHYQWQTDSDINFGWADVGTDSPIYDLKAFDAGLNARVIVSYTDGHGNAEQLTSLPTWFIGENNSDLNGSLGITGSLVEGQTVTADTSHLRDADGLGDFFVIWSVEGVNNFFAPSLTLIPFYSNHVVTLSISYLDGLGNSQVASTVLGPVINVNQAPVVTGPLLFGTPIVGATIQGNINNFIDGDGVPLNNGFHYQWQRDSGGGYVNIATDNFSYVPVNADIGAHLRVIISYVDRTGTAEQLTSEGSAAVIAGNTPHTGTATITGTAVTGQLLTANTATLADAQGLGTLHYQWFRQGGTVGNDTPTYLLTNADLGQQIGLQVSYSDLYGASENVFAAASAVVTSAPGVVLGVSQFPGPFYTEQASPVLVGASTTISDAQSATLVGGTVAITGGYVAGDLLDFSNQNGITGSYDTNTHVLTLSGTASVANYQTALRSITFSTPSDNPTNFGASPTRTLSWQVDDGQPSNHASNVGITTPVITAVNDAPSIKADTFTTTEQTVVTGNLFADNGAGADSDLDNLLVVTAVSGSAANVGHPIGAPGPIAIIIVNADGSFSFDPNHLYDARPAPGSGAANTTAVLHFTYQSAGGSGVVTVNITGADSDDTLLGSAGNDTFNGGIGTNTLVLTGSHGDYAISGNGAITTFADLRGGSPDGTDTAQNIQIYKFADGTFARDNGSGELSQTVTDGAGTALWASQLLRFDAQGSLQAQITFNDGGSHEGTTFNNGWLWSTDYYDDLNRLTTKVGTRDDGTHWLVLYDAANQYSWANAQIDYDANWNVTNVSGNRDSGAVPVTMKDVAAALDIASWSTAPYDPDQGSAAANALFGGANRDVLFGFAGGDTLTAMGGNDYLNGGKGSDTLSGGGGNDRFVFVVGDGNDTITDFTHGSDVIDLHGYDVTDLATLQTLMYQDGANLLIALDPQNHITLQGVTIAQLGAGDFAFS